MTATLSPFTRRSASRIGNRVYRKQVLPIGTIHYKGQTITFDREFLTDLAESFRRGAYDQVPFVLADAENRHTMDPERFRGEIKGFELSEDGLDAIVEFTPDGAALVERNPNLGVSARIVEGVAKADGRTFRRAIQHVLGTMDPRVTGLRPWTAIDLSVYTDGEQVVDLTDETYEETDMGTTATAQASDSTQATTSADADKDQPLDLSKLTDAEFEALLEAAEGEDDDDEDDDEDDADDTNDDQSDGDVSDVDLSTVTDGEGDITTDNINSVGATTTTTATTAPKSRKTKAKTASATVDLANSVVDANDRSDVQQMKIELAAERWKSKRKDLVRAGVPPFILDLAEPVLAAPESAVIDLSNENEPVDATSIITKMVEGMRGIVDIKPEVGHSVDLSEDGSNGDDALMSLWDKEYGKA